MKLFDVYPLMPVTPVHAQGCIVTDIARKKYLDLYGGHAVISIGHNHPHYNARLTEQLHAIAFYSNAVQNPLQEIFAERFGAISGCTDYQFFVCNSGAEANENALKLASFVNGRKKMVAFNGSFHGRTSAAVAATQDVSIVAPLNSQHEVAFCALNDFEAAEMLIDDQTCAVIIEGIQGVAGVIEPSDEFLLHLQSLCLKHGALLILDEVQSGCGRTGDYFAHQQSGVQPDLITVAKGIGNGFPMGAVLIAPHIKPKHGMLGTTFGGNYLACAAGLAVLDVLEKESLLVNARQVGHYLSNALRQLPSVKKITGRGLMIGVQLDVPAASLRKKLVEECSIFTGSASDKNVIRLLPPLCLTLKQAEQFVDVFSHVSQLVPA